MFTLLPNATILPFPNPGDPVSSRTAYLSSTVTSLVACITPMIALMYLVVLSWVYRYSQRNPKPLNKASGVWLQRYAPCKLCSWSSLNDSTNLIRRGVHIPCVQQLGGGMTIILYSIAENSSILPPTRFQSQLGLFFNTDFNTTILIYKLVTE